MITLYGRRKTASSAPMAVFEMLGLDYQFEAVEPGQAGHLAVHPLGRVPAVRWEDGAVMIESAAIIMHAIDRFDAEGALAPRPGTPARAGFYEALLFLVTQLFSTYQRYYQTRRVADEAHWGHIRDMALAQQHEHWAVLDSRLEAAPWMAGEAFSAADVYLTMLVFWWPDVAALCAAYPNIARVCRGALAHPGAEKAFDFHGHSAEIAALRAG